MLTSEKIEKACATDRVDRNRLRKQLPVLAPSGDFPLPRTRAGHGRMDLSPEVGVVHPRAQQVDGLAYRLLGLVTRDPGKGRVHRDDGSVGVGDQYPLVAVLHDVAVQPTPLVRRHSVLDLRKVGNHSDRIAVLIAQHRQREPGVEHFARLLAAAHLEPASPLVQEQLGHRAVRLLLVVGVQEQEMAPQRLVLRVAKQDLRDDVPAGQVAVQVHGDDGFGQLFDDALHVQRPGAARARFEPTADRGQLGGEFVQQLRLRIALQLPGPAAQLDAALDDGFRHGWRLVLRARCPASTGGPRASPG